MHLLLAALLLAQASGAAQNSVTLTYEISETVARPTYNADSRVVLNGSGNPTAEHVEHLGSTTRWSATATYHKRLRVELGPGGAILSSTDPAVLANHAVLELFGDRVRERVAGGATSWTTTDATGRKAHYRVVAQSAQSAQLEVQYASTRLRATYDRSLGVPRTIETSTPAAKTTYTLIQPYAP